MLSHTLKICELLEVTVRLCSIITATSFICIFQIQEFFRKQFLSRAYSKVIPFTFMAFLEERNIFDIFPISERKHSWKQMMFWQIISLYVLDLTWYSPFSNRVIKVIIKLLPACLGMTRCLNPVMRKNLSSV